MKVLVCGGRDYRNYNFIFEVLGQIKSQITEVIHGDARGADTGADVWARINGVKVVPFPANWKTHGKAAGFIRNREMLDYDVDLVIAFPGGNGTANMIKQAKERGIIVRLVTE